MSTSKHQPAPGAATVTQFADALGVSRWTVQRMISASTIRSLKIGRSRRIPWTELDRVLSASSAPTRNHGEALA